MAYALANLVNVQKRVISILNANPGTFSATVSGTVGAFASQEEIDLAILEADEEVCVSGYFQSINDSLSNPFAVTTAPLLDQDQVPFHHGTINKCEVSKGVLNLTSANINTTTDRITSVEHGFATGDMVSWLIVSGGLPSPFAVLTNYFVIKIDADNIQLATTYANAVFAGTAIDITTTGSGRWELISWQIGVEADSLDSVINATAVGNAYVGTDAMDFLYRPQDGQIYTPAQYARVTYPEYIRTSALQARQSEEFLIICGAIKMLTKNASPAPFSYYLNESIRGLQQLVQDGVYTQSPDAGEGDNK